MTVRLEKRDVHVLMFRLRLPAPFKVNSRMDVSVPTVTTPAMRGGLLRWLLRVNLTWLFLGLLLAGFSLVFLSWLLEVDAVAFDPASVGVSLPVREVGYLSALNWGLTYLCFFPVIGVMLVAVLQDIPRTLAELQRINVLHSAPGSRLAESIVADWTAGDRMRDAFIVGLGILAPLAYSLNEW